MKIELNPSSSQPAASRPAAEYDTPSRLVNLRVHDADLRRAQSQPQETEKPAAKSEALKPEPAKPATPKPKAEKPALEPLVDPGDDTSELALSIAADYTTANLDAAISNLPVKIEARDSLSAAIYAAQGSSSIDEIAKTASEAIAAIRNATDPDDLAEQLDSLRRFATHIKARPVMPEVLELSDTIEKFISVAEKSTSSRRVVIKNPAKAKAPTQSTAKPAAKTVKSAEKPSIAISKPATKSTTKPTAKPPARKPLFKSPKPVTKSATPVKSSKLITRQSLSAKKRPAVRKVAVNDDKALRAALRSVEKMENTEPQHKPTKIKRGGGKRFALAFTCATLCVAGIIYFVGSNIPDVSIRVAAMQTGVEAHYPSYIPRDFSLKGISSEDSKISLSFTGPNNASFTLTEEKCSWDSAALQRNFVEPNWSSAYSTTHEQGITIFINDSSAAWVNGGVLYKLTAPSGTLTKKQLRNIVTSM